MLDSNWSEELFIRLKMLKTLCHGPMLLVILTVKKLLECFMQKKLQKTNQKEFRVEKVIEIKGDKLYVIWKAYDNGFNSWMDKKGK